MTQKTSTPVYRAESCFGRQQLASTGHPNMLGMDLVLDTIVAPNTGLDTCLTPDDPTMALAH